MTITSDIPIWAAGAVPLRGPENQREVLLVHRPAYGDWTLPKGKARQGELLPATAVREVAEETSARVRLAAPLTPIRYPLASAMKLVSWWVGVTMSLQERTPDAEVDQVAWMTPKKALKTLTYSDERAVLTEAASLPDTTPLVILRHAKAKRRETWSKADRLRPLNHQGNDQLDYIGQLLHPFGVKNFISSTATRCLDSLHSPAKLARAEITAVDLLYSDKAKPADIGAYITRLARAVGASGIPTVVCSHQPVIPWLLAPLSIPARPLSTASCVIAHLDSRGALVRAEWHDTLHAKL